MKKTNITVFTTLLVISSILWGCGLGKMVKKYPEVKYEVKPEILETHGGKINVTVNATIPAKYFHKKAIVDFTPILKYNGSEYALKTLTLQGEKATGDGVVIASKAGGSFSYSDVIPYKPGMENAELKVNCKATLKSKEIFLGERKLADGVIYTSERSIHTEKIILATKATVPSMEFFDKNKTMTKSADVYFAYMQHNINMKLANNKNKENKVKLDELKAFALNNWANKSYSLNAWASPEGEETYNQGLSERRAKSAEKFFKKELADKYKKQNKKKFKDILTFITSPKGEDWDGFVNALKNSNIKDKNNILNVVNAQKDIQKREQEIRNMTIVYKEIEDQILPALRRAEISITATMPVKSDEQILKFATSTPDSLNLIELLYAGEIAQELNTKVAIYKATINQNPKDWRAYNNLGYTYIQLNNLNEAQSILEQANSIEPNNGIINNNLGVVAAKKEDKEAAVSYYQTAQTNGQNTNYNNGIIDIKKGNYSNAISNLSSEKCDYNYALALLLNKDNAAAQNALSCSEKTAEAYYLMAVIGARTGNVGMIAENLRNAIKANAKYRDQAKEDKEFIKYFTNTQFIEAIK